MIVSFLNIVENIRQKHYLQSLTVGLQGMAFKADVDDIRSSLSYKIKHLLDLYADKVLINDHYVQTDPDILPLEKALKKEMFWYFIADIVNIETST